jgi:hypothetical protein
MDPRPWGEAIGGLGPMGPLVFSLVFALAVIVIVFGSATVALTGIRRWGVPGLAYVLAGLWRELHGLRSDLRAWADGDPLEPLEPLDEKRSLFPPPRRPTPPAHAASAAPAPAERSAAPASRRNAAPRVPQAK